MAVAVAAAGNQRNGFGLGGSYGAQPAAQDDGLSYLDFSDLMVTKDTPKSFSSHRRQNA